MDRVIIHVDMDAFFAAVEVRDNPALAGKPLIIGALPHERGVVSTCSYEARKYGVRSAMSIKEAYRLCPDGVYMHPSSHKYRKASDCIRDIWYTYTDRIECVSLDEGYLDVSDSEHLFGGARRIGHEIKRRVKSETGLTCSVGIGYSMMSAKLASEERKPDGFFEIRDAEELRSLISNRNVRVVSGVGEKTAAALHAAGIRTVSDIYANRRKVCELLGNHGRQIVEMADGVDSRVVTPYSEPKSMGKEHTFQRDITDFSYLRDVLRLIAGELSFDIRQQGIYCRTVTLKITYADMRSITRSVSGEAINSANDIYDAAAAQLHRIEKRSVRLVGISLSNLIATAARQISLEDMGEGERREKLEETILGLQRRFGSGIIKTGSELGAENRLSEQGGMGDTQ